VSYVITAADIPDFQPAESLSSVDHIKDRFIQLKATQVKLVDEMRALVLEKQGVSFFNFSLSNRCIKCDQTQSLTDDTLVQVLIRLNFSDMLRTAAVCQRFYKILKKNTLWMLLLKEHSPAIYKKLNTTLDPEKWIALAKFKFALNDLSHRINGIEKDHKVISALNTLTIAAVTPIILQAASSLVVAGARQLAAIREANILAQTQEYMRTHPEVTLDAAKEVVTNRLNELIAIMC